jgi:hypothetical protein
VEVARTETLTIAFCAGRTAFGVALVGLPSRVGSSWLGPDAAGPPTQVALRGLGARDLALAGGAAWAAASGRGARPWLVATVGGDLADIASTLLAGEALSRRARAGTLALAGSSALAGALLAWAVDE